MLLSFSKYSAHPPNSSQNGSFLPLYWLSVGAGTFQYSGIYFFFCDSGTTCFQHVFPLSLFLKSRDHTVRLHG